MRPRAGVGKLKHAPPMQANDLPVVEQAVSPAISEHGLRHVGQVGNLRGGWLPPLVGSRRGIGPIDNRPQLTKLPHKCTSPLIAAPLRAAPRWSACALRAARYPYPCRRAGR